MKKNFIKVPNNVLEKLKTIEKKYITVGIAKKISLEDIKRGCYTSLGITLYDGKIKFNEKILPNITSGRYSKYNMCGRTIKIKDKPKIDKWFSGEVYPYGNTNASKVSTSYTKKVYQTEEWLPQYMHINVKLDSLDNNFAYFVFEIEDIIDICNKNYERQILFDINLLQENCKGFDIYSDDNYVYSDMINVEEVPWELLPPGETHIQHIIKNFKTNDCKDNKIIEERFDFIKSLNPIKFVKGTNKFSQYFGAVFNNDVLVLENKILGNAIYVIKEDWQSFSQLSRTDLINLNSNKVIRIEHRGDWKTILQKNISA